jgi:acyl-CoA thioesterase YciA
LPTDKELVLKVIPMPGDCNANGDIFGGWVMAQVDLAGSVLPARRVQGRMATVAVKNSSSSSRCAWATAVVLCPPVACGPHLGDGGGGGLCRAHPRQGRYIKVTEATLTYVAIDEAGRPRAIPPEVSGN